MAAASGQASIPSRPRSDGHGPGSPALIAVAKAHQAAARHPLSGWWGHAAPFAFDRDFQPDAGIKRFLCGTPPIISLRGVDAALDALEGVEVSALREKSLALTRKTVDQF